MVWGNPQQHVFVVEGILFCCVPWSQKKSCQMTDIKFWISSWHSVKQDQTFGHWVGFRWLKLKQLHAHTLRGIPQKQSMFRKAWLGCELEGDKCNFRLAQKKWCKKTWCIKHFNLSWLPGWMVADDCGMFPAFSMTYTCSGSSPHIAAASSLMLSWCTKWLVVQWFLALPKIEFLPSLLVLTSWHENTNLSFLFKILH